MLRWWREELGRGRWHIRVLLWFCQVTLRNFKSRQFTQNYRSIPRVFPLKLKRTPHSTLPSSPSHENHFYIFNIERKWVRKLETDDWDSMLKGVLIRFCLKLVVHRVKIFYLVLGRDIIEIIFLLPIRKIIEWSRLDISVPSWDIKLRSTEKKSF